MELKKANSLEYKEPGTIQEYTSVEPIYDFARDESGRLRIKETGKNDWAEIAKIDKANCGYYNLMRNIKNGDMSAAMKINQPTNWGDADIVDIQNTLAKGPGELSKLQKQAETIMKEGTEALNKKFETNMTPAEWIEGKKTESLIDNQISKLKAQLKKLEEEKNGN